MRYVAPVLDRLLSVVLALAMVTIGVVTLVEVVAAVQGADRVVVSQDAIDALGRRAWTDGAVVASLAGLALLGVSAVAAGLWPRPPLLLPSGAGRDGASSGVAVERRSLESVLGDELAAMEGVTDSRVRAGRSRMAVRLTVDRLAPADIEAQVRSAVSGQLSRSGVLLDTTVRLRRRGSSDEVAQP